jgi:hypothetical protein
MERPLGTDEDYARLAERRGYACSRCGDPLYGFVDFQVEDPNRGGVCMVIYGVCRKHYLLTAKSPQRWGHDALAAYWRLSPEERRRHPGAVSDEWWGYGAMHVYRVFHAHFMGDK